MIILYQFWKLLHKGFPYFVLFLAPSFKRLINYLLPSLLNLTYRINWNIRQYSTTRYYYGLRQCFFFFSISVRISILLSKTVFYRPGTGIECAIKSGARVLTLDPRCIPPATTWIVCWPASRESI